MCKETVSYFTVQPLITSNNHKKEVIAINCIVKYQTEDAKFPCLKTDNRLQQVVDIMKQVLACFIFPSDLLVKLRSARSSNGTTDNVGDIMLNWVSLLFNCI